MGMITPIIIPVQESKPCTQCKCAKCECGCHGPASFKDFLLVFTFVSVLIYLIISGLEGGVDASTNDYGKGTSIIAKFIQLSPSYKLMHFLASPHNEN